MNTDEACAFVKLVALNPEWMDCLEKRRMVIGIAQRILRDTVNKEMIIPKYECASTAKTERQG